MEVVSALVALSPMEAVPGSLYIYRGFKSAGSPVFGQNTAMTSVVTLSVCMRSKGALTDDHGSAYPCLHE